MIKFDRRPAEFPEPPLLAQVRVGDYCKVSFGVNGVGERLWVKVLAILRERKTGARLFEGEFANNSVLTADAAFGVQTIFYDYNVLAVRQAEN